MQSKQALSIVQRNPNEVHGKMQSAVGKSQEQRIAENIHCFVRRMQPPVGVKSSST